MLHDEMWEMEVRYCAASSSGLQASSSLRPAELQLVWEGGKLSVRAISAALHPESRHGLVRLEHQSRHLQVHPCLS